ncbi:hypothetical protein [Micromonospora sp. HM5-17]|uniref:hypothetical protein n=1 Tax=Micromonospora sp. HM5-17 TaxID=2487710 RepID=UPI000F4621A5|nr:hypothetical protein [Micromonospora sp. HM5-17]ROT33427.1 hypothetical protein EF879_00040 [Micromonospora sp. HM5-17]
MSDDRLATLRAADLTQIEAARKRYEHISATIDDAVTRLQKIVDAGEEGLRGQWVVPLKKDAEDLKDKLSKAAVRYRDVATEIKKYEPELAHAIDEVNAATRDEEEGNASLTRANAMPDPQPGPDGTIPPEEEQKGDDKRRAQDAANAQITAAKNRLTRALDALDVAGKRFGDAVNCKRYDDGLTDKINWRVMAVFKKISEAFGIIAMVLTALAFLIPGLNVLAIAGAVAGAVLLIADSVLLAGGDGSVLSVVLDAVGLGFAGLGAAFGAFGKQINAFTKLLKTFPHLKINPDFRPGGQVIELFDLSRPPAIGAPRPGFFDVGKSWFSQLFGTNVFKDLGFLSGISALGNFFGHTASGLRWIFASWGGLNQLFNLGAGLIIAGMQATQHEALEGV